MCTDTPCVQCSCCRDHTKVCEAQSIFNLLLRSITRLLSSKGDLFTSTDNPIRHHSLARQLHTRTHCCSTRLQCNHDREGWHLCCKRQHHVGSQLRHSTTLIMSRSSLLLCLMLHHFLRAAILSCYSKSNQHPQITSVSQPAQRHAHARPHPPPERPGLWHAGAVS